MKNCPHCKQEIPDDHMVCQYCRRFTGELPQPPSKVPWYFQSHSIFIGFLCIGPFILPLVWMNPEMSKKRKIIVTIIISVFTLILGGVCAWALRSLGKYYSFIFDQI